MDWDDLPWWGKLLIFGAFIGWIILTFTFVLKKADEYEAKKAQQLHQIEKQEHNKIEKGKVTMQEGKVYTRQQMVEVIESLVAQIQDICRYADTLSVKTFEMQKDLIKKQKDLREIH